MKHSQPIENCRACLSGAIGRHSEPPRGFCSTCGHVYRLTQTGLVWTHNNHIRDKCSGAYGMRCSGSGQQPQEEW